MIPVQLKPEPATFDARVRVRGLAYLKKNGFALHLGLPSGTEPPSYWRESLDDLHAAYGGVCAYLGIYFERVSGLSVDHYIAKSTNAQGIYEWDNYRLACSTLNSRKRDYSTVLDPCYLASDLFRLQLSSGHIYPKPGLAAAPTRVIEQTIERLGLDDATCREMRARRFQEYIQYNLPQDYLKMMSPFIWAEANRQGLL
ncbi:hypothetical protein [Pseudomonas sp. TSRC2-2]|uniref:hypothetical protein n=1 Tax=unclassified Pseudomonas TaxID=196821 RepID=UPI003CE6D3B3